MITKLRRIFLLLLCAVLFPMPRTLAETTLYLGGSDKNSAEYKTFTKAHPELTVNTETNIYLSTDEIISAFLTGEFAFVCQSLWGGRFC
ncbi:MAG: hypothetical protein RR547_07155 [Raoultibacter sp.]